MWLESISKPACNEERCPTCGGGVQRRPHGEMYAGSFILDGNRVEIRRKPNEGYGDPIVLDAITQYFDGGLYRVYPSSPYYARGGRLLHRAAWSDAFGEIPKGCHIHHKDSNPANNALSNLECVESREHLSRTWRDGARSKPGYKHFTDKARDAAAEWHRSEAGRLWHKRHAERSRSWEKWKREPKPCLHCGNTFEALVRKSGHSQVYCTTNCKSAAYNKRVSDSRRA